MRYAISYVSTAEPNLPPEVVKDLLTKATKYNNTHDITGVLLYSENNFFQLLEGEKEKITLLFSYIEKDPRHHNIIKFIEKPVSGPSNEGYISEVITGNTEEKDSRLRKYLNHLDVLDSMSRTAVKRVIETILM